MRFTSLRRTAVLALTTVALVSSSGCFGSFNAVRKVYGFNKTVSPNKFVREVVFLAFNIVPVYGVASLADAVVINSVEFWTGKNPVQMTSRIKVDDKTSLVRAVTETGGQRVMTVQVFQSDRLVSTTTMEVIDEQGVAYETVLVDGRRTSGVVRMNEDGDAVAVPVSAPSRF